MAVTDEDLKERTQKLVDEVDPHATDQYTFRGEQFDRGLAMVQFPEGKGGLDLSPGKQSIINEVLTKAKVPYHDLIVNPIGIGMGAPVVLTYGTDEMHDKHLRKIFTGEDIWCQLFSEPTHGSDVAGIPSRGVRDGEEWVVNGQKVWTTLAHVSNFGMLLTRTNPDVPKHKGLSYFVVDMHSPGVEVRPLYQVTGEAEFNEVFFTDTRVPHANLLGDEGDGWRVAITTLMNERVALGGGGGGKGSGPIGALVNLWETRKDDLDEVSRAVFRDKVADLWIRAEALRLTNRRAKQAASTGNPGPEGSVGKGISAELNQKIYEACMDLLGAEATLHSPGYPMIRSDDAGGGAHGELTWQFLRSRANTIEGGTTEIMKNILGERVLGLPGDVRVDKELPFNQIPK